MLWLTKLCTMSLHFFFFFNDTATTEIYTLPLHDALPISISMTVESPIRSKSVLPCRPPSFASHTAESSLDRKSTRLNSSHANISYAVFCLKKKKRKKAHVILLQ